MVNLDATTPQLKAVKQVLDAATSRDLTTLKPLLSKNFSFKTFPEIPELPGLTGNDFLTKYGAAFGVFAKIEVTLHEVIEAPGKAVTHCSALFTTTEGTTHEYDTVAIFTFAEEDGELKILDIKDFSDPDKRGAFHAGVAKALGMAVA